jgi:hypothetical protein
VCLGLTIFFQKLVCTNEIRDIVVETNQKLSCRDLLTFLLEQPMMEMLISDINDVIKLISSLPLRLFQKEKGASDCMVHVVGFTTTCAISAYHH